MSEPSALVILFDGVEEMEAVAPIDLLRRAGVRVTVVSASEDLGITGRNDIRLRAEIFLSECLESDFDLVVLPGGPGHAALLDRL